MKKLENKVVLVTGGSGGIGSQICQKFADEGATVAIHYSSNQKAAIDVQKAIEDISGTALIFQADLTKQNQAQQLIDDVVKAFGKIDILVNNAGVMKNVPFGQITENDFELQMKMNLWAPIMLMQMAIPYFSDTGGSIINVSSMLAKIPRPLALVYSSSKVALQHFSIGMLREELVKQKKIRINVVSPGPIDTEMTKSIPPERRKAIMDLVLVEPRFGRSDEIANVVVYLSSQEAYWIDGQIIVVDGGYTS